MKRYPLKIFVSYAREDRYARVALIDFLELLERRGVVTLWSDAMIVPGTSWQEAIASRLEEADLILFLISPNFERSDFIREHELPQALRRHNSGKARVIPVLITATEGVEEQTYAQIQWLPPDKPLDEWEDQVAGLAAVSDGIERSARDLIEASGGAFDFGPRMFTLAELANLPLDVRSRVDSGMARIRAGLIANVPERRLDHNLLIATWSLRRFGSSRHRDVPDATYFVAQIVSAFDLVCLQHVDINTAALERVMGLLGPDWDYLINDILPGRSGNSEHMAVLFYKPRVAFRNLAGQVMMPELAVTEHDSGRHRQAERRAAVQFEQSPMIARFRPVGSNRDFEVVTLHVIWGSERERLEEYQMLGSYLSWRKKSYPDADIVVLGNFNLSGLDDVGIELLRKAEIELPEKLLLPTGALSEKFFDLIGWVSHHRAMPLEEDNPGGTFAATDYAFRSEDMELYRGNPKIDELMERHREDPDRLHQGFLRWSSMLLSDHKLIWAAIRI